MTQDIHYIYKITCLINNKIYIGQTKNISKRWYQHRKEAEKEHPLMTINSAMKKYGIDYFIFEIIDFAFSHSQADCIENCLIEYYESHISKGKGYNVSLGGSTAPKSKEWCDHMSKIMPQIMKEKGIKSTPLANAMCKTPEAQAKRLKSVAWYRPSKETREKMSKSHIGKNKNEIRKGATWKLVDGKRVWSFKEKK